MAHLNATQWKWNERTRINKYNKMNVWATNATLSPHWINNLNIYLCYIDIVTFCYNIWRYRISFVARARTSLRRWRKTNSLISVFNRTQLRVTWNNLRFFKIKVINFPWWWKIFEWNEFHRDRPLSMLLHFYYRFTQLWRLNSFNLCTSTWGI